MKLCLAFLSLLLGVSSEKYRGKYVGKLNSYHHQVSGDVYAVDAYTLLITGFNYDGNGPDTFFWAGASNRPGPQGFIVSIASFDGTRNGSSNLPKDDAPPHFTNHVKRLLNDKLHGRWIGRGNTYFWVGVGPQPSSKGFKVPDEYGYLEPLRLYNSETITLQLPGDLTVFDLDWLSIYNVETKENFGSVILPDNPNVPPSLAKIIPHKSTLPNCIQLHKDLQVSWEIFGPQITIQLAGQINDNSYMSFGLSGSSEKAQMLGSDVAIAFIDGHRGYALDYNITANSPCVKVLGQYKGVCRDDLIGAIDNNQLHTFAREDEITYITYRRTLISSDAGDKEFKTEGVSQVIWALGRLDANNEPAFHDIYPRGSTPIELGRKEPYNTCYSFTKTQSEPKERWERPKIIDKSLRTFTATLGPSGGGQRGYPAITGMSSNGLAWYLNGLLIPEIWMKRGFTYAFRIFGGNNPHSAEFYNPFIITDEPHGGVERLSEAAQKQIRVLGGVQYTLRGQPRPTSAGPLCLARHKGVDRRLDDDFPTFRKFNKSLHVTCESGDPAILEVTPNSSWPDTVYYNSYTHSNMGWKIHIIDSFSASYSSSPQLTSFMFCAFQLIALSTIPFII
ncbi:protein Skeletor, isoforms B/C [Nilaparvata lugens]|uniref:protein Skeletor, isoforms B/C n=1 Tax=Nilaparvata lugens TaxID=108931 RepID=UPI00193DCD1F|nr:protein Skeletor, isoforms B/C [Nilaparvata lugens]